MIHRLVQPEILDSLPQDHPDALKNRRDIALLNSLMRNYRWLTHALSREILPDERLLELAAGTGDLARCVWATVPKINPSRYTALDLWQKPLNWPADARWETADLLEYDGYAEHPVITGNLILHQFDDATLSEKIAPRLQSARLLIFNEPVRRKRHIWQLRAAFALGLNHVSRHDGRVSIQGGFVGNELPELLSLAPEKWDVSVEMTFLGAYRLIAKRRHQP